MTGGPGWSAGFPRLPLAAADRPGRESACTHHKRPPRSASGCKARAAQWLPLLLQSAGATLTSVGAYGEYMRPPRSASGCKARAAQWLPLLLQSAGATCAARRAARSRAAQVFEITNRENREKQRASGVGGAETQRPLEG